MNIILLHAHFDDNHLEAVKDEMKTLGAPTIKAVWSDCYDAWVALEGCHRIRAAYDMGITPIIEEIEYRDDITMVEVGVEIEDDCTISEVVGDAWQSEMVEFED